MIASEAPAVCVASGRVCERGGKPGMFLPVTDVEFDLPSGVRALIYGLAMVYFFVGVAIIADIFVASIEEITSKWKKVKKGGQVRTQKIWNETVATLTLMALGSSAPEIFLAVIDVFKNDFHAAELGPSTIVGSASFNLMVIIAACIVAIPAGEVRVIKELPAFYITAFFSLGAYMWLVFILVVNTKDAVDPWEAIMTFLFLPMLIWVSYKSDVGAFDCILEKLGMTRIVDPECEEGSRAALHGRFQSQLAKDVRNSVNGTDEVGATQSEVAKAMTAAKERYTLLGFKDEHMEVILTGDDQEVQIPVHVSGSRSGAVLCKYKTAGFTARPGAQFEPLEDALEVGIDEKEAFVTLKVNRWTGNKARSQLLLILEDADGAEFDPETDGGEESSILTVTLESERSPLFVKKVLSAVVDLDGLTMGMSDWKDQMVNTFYVGGSKEDQEEAGAIDWAMHISSLPWKMLFAFVPPPTLFGGWFCFATSLCCIGLLTSFVSDLAELFGCVLDLSDVVTAITFVALGTSMPDLFASLTAAKEDETADASVVNVTGSNSVNVFLGLGLPWTICAIYWAVKERTAEWAACYPVMAAKLDGSKMVFVVESGFIGFSVIVFSIVCLAALALIALRRRWIGAELGGPTVPKFASAAQLLLLWSGWMALVIWRVMRFNEDPSAIEQGIASFGFLAVEATGMVMTMTILYKYRVPPQARRLSKGSSSHSDRPSFEHNSFEHDPSKACSPELSKELSRSLEIRVQSKNKVVPTIEATADKVDVVV